ncbi:amidase [Variovorax sp.]|jgi:aspartyl-tRNA(Asn)/glutamyl-tRNA(Gln) amidotransferase subunit A|uniref:amidase n=1 Tax=Variovorax sp. TaxID=1871043 RepID=UPI001202210D|nr:amidase [Variovorax sp.]TAJ62958.1 MAG: amidase [Variovorax sp.]
MTKKNLYDLGAAELVAAYARRELSPVEVARSVNARIEALEPRLCATWLFRPELALEQARASEARWLAGTQRGALDGVPVTIKDNLATAGDPMPLGTAAYPLVPMAQDSPPAARLKEDGTVLVAKTTMPDVGMLSSGLSTFHHLSRNPWDLSRTPGGSSAGAGSAAAAGYGPLHVGTDIGGSLRLPASWCGIYSLKPSFGRIPLSTPYMGRCAGPMTRTVEDSALMMASMAQPDARDYSELPPGAIDWAAFAVEPDFIKGKRVGLLMEAGCGLPLDPQIAEAVRRAAKRIEDAGAHVEPMQPFMTPKMLQGMDHFWRMRSLSDLRTMSAEQRAKMLPYILTWAESAAGFSGEHIYEAYSQFIATRAAAVAATVGFDFVISPVSPNMPAPAEHASPTNDPLRSLEHIGFTVPYNMSEQPAASINCGYSAEGLPIGLQIIGRRFDDLGVLQFSRAFEQIREPQKPWPELG